MTGARVSSISCFPSLYENSTFDCSTKELLYAQQYNACWKAHGCLATSSKANHTSPQLPVIPEALISAALQQLPTQSALFRDAAKSADLLDETGLDDWDTGPPYVTGQPLDTSGEQAFTQHLIEVMHGCHLQMQRDRAWHRYG